MHPIIVEAQLMATCSLGMATTMCVHLIATTYKPTAFLEPSLVYLVPGTVVYQGMFSYNSDGGGGGGEGEGEGVNEAKLLDQECNHQKALFFSASNEVMLFADP